MLGWCAVAVLAHAPDYESACSTPKYGQDVSQAAYKIGSGGIEVHCSSNDCPFDVTGGEVIEFDAVFAEPYDLSTFDLYVGCSGCMPEDPIVLPPVNVTHFQAGELEPFTGTKYYSAFAKSDRFYNTSLLNETVCDQGHWTLRLADYNNRTDGKRIRWSAVYGCTQFSCEKFTFSELMLFPYFILRNHGTSWNQLSWTFPTIAILTPLLFTLYRHLAYFLGWRSWLSPWFYGGNPREIFYEIAVWGFLIAALEMFFHLVYAQIGIPIAYGFWVGLLAVVLFPNGLAILLIYIIWTGLRHRRDRWVIASPWWALLELPTAFSFFLLFGAGLFLGPAAWCIAAFLRFIELFQPIPPPTTKLPPKNDVVAADDKENVTDDDEDATLATPAPPAAETAFYPRTSLPSLFLNSSATVAASVP